MTSIGTKRVTSSERSCLCAIASHLTPPVLSSTPDVRPTTFNVMDRQVAAQQTEVSIKPRELEDLPILEDRYPDVAFKVCYGLQHPKRMAH